MPLRRPRFVFDFPLTEEGGPRRLSLFGAPRQVLRALHLDEVHSVLRAAETCARQGDWVAGFVSYDAAPAFDKALRIAENQTPAQPLAWFGVFDAPWEETDLPPPSTTPPCHSNAPWQPSIDPAHFAADINRLRQHIQDGDAYQINHTLRLHTSFTGDALAWFTRLRAAQPDGYCAYLDIDGNADGLHILSASPELFFRRDADRITTRPMKGTARRGRWAEEDRQHAEELRTSEKNRAENLMIVDLLRNDLSRIAQPHSVKVDELFAIERHPTLWQMTSTVRATTRPATSLDTLFSALFPCGSVTGAPKAKAMELIAKIETEPRGIYCGAIGLLQPGGNALFNVAIRTVTLQAGQATCGIGSGITWDSTAHDEHAETLLKARFLAHPAAAPPTPPHLFETLRLEQGNYRRLERHLGRLTESADYFGIPCALDACQQKLHSLAQQHPHGSWRVRLDLSAEGIIQAQASPLPPTPCPAGFVLAQHPVDRNDPMLYHKTTWRAVYEQALATAQATHTGVFEVLLWNEADELTEFTRGNLVLEIDGTRYTPPLPCGLLNGVLRQELLETGQIQERILTRNDLHCAHRILFINSLRGEIALHEIRNDSTSDREPGTPHPIR